MLFLELALRGYNLSSLRDNETTAEIVKIGNMICIYVCLLPTCFLLCH